MFINASRCLTDSSYWRGDDAKWSVGEDMKKIYTTRGTELLQIVKFWRISLNCCKIYLLLKIRAFIHPKCYSWILLSVDTLIKSPSGFNKLPTCLSKDSMFLCISHDGVNAQSPPSALWSRSRETNLLVFINHDSKRRGGQFSEAQRHNEVV